MAETAPAAAPAPKKKAPRPKKEGPTVGELVLKAVAASKDRNGISFVALKKELGTQGVDVEHNMVYIKRAVRHLMEKGKLIQTKGHGASGSFKVNKSAVEKPKKEAKKPAAKKPAAAKKPKAAATPKKVKKPAAAAKKATKSPKKAAGSPKKAAKKVAKPKTVKPKKAAAKK